MVTIHVVHHLDPEFERRVLSTIYKQTGNIMAAIDDLTKNVTDNTNLVQSAVTLMGNLKTELDAAIASGDMSKVQALSDALGKNDAELAAAIAANTPAAPADTTTGPSSAPADTAAAPSGDAGATAGSTAS
jgi:hypothetical protein